MSDKKIIFKESFAFIALCFLMVALILNNFSSSVKEGLSLYAGIVLPSVFPFFFITAYFSKLNLTKVLLYKTSPFFYKAFKISHYSGFAYAIGLISGYPSGSKLIADLTEGGFIDKSEAERACCLASNPSLTFCVLTVGEIMFSSVYFGIKVYLVCILSSFLTGLAFCRTKKPITRTPKPQNLTCVYGVMYDSAFSAFTTALLVGTLITLFYVFCDVLSFYGFLLPIEKFFTMVFKDETIGKGITFSIFESTKGLKVILDRKNFDLILPITCAVLGFGGISIILQSTTLLKKAKIKTARFIFSKIFCAVLCFLLGYLITLF